MVFITHPTSLHGTEFEVESIQLRDGIKKALDGLNVIVYPDNVPIWQNVCQVLDIPVRFIHSGTGDLKFENLWLLDGTEVLSLDKALAVLRGSGEGPTDERSSSLGPGKPEVVAHLESTVATGETDERYSH